DNGEFEGKPFLDYAAWLDDHRPRQRPPGAAEVRPGRTAVGAEQCRGDELFPRNGCDVAVHGSPFRIFGSFGSFGSFGFTVG
ncbi:hypothetical protein AB0Q94_37225, partial [Streptomyces sp. NPDC088270]